MEDYAHPFGKKKRPMAYIDPISCTGCGWCAMFCVVECIEMQPDGLYTVDPSHCIGCRSCMVNCFYDAVTMRKPESEEIEP